MILKERLLKSKLFRDSFWAIFGNGLGNAFMLLAGILIARYLGKDLYGEYGIVKTTMLYIASFATFGLGFTSTKYIAACVKEDTKYLRAIVRDSMLITLFFSGFIAVLLFIFAPLVATYLEEKGLTIALRALAIVIIFKAVTTTQIGILSGFKAFKHIAYNSLSSGAFMLVSCIPLTYFWGLPGSLLALLLSQMFNAIINFFSVRSYTKSLQGQEEKSYIKEMMKFSFPVALQESSFTICNWAAIMLLTKYSSLGELGIYSASAQWNSIILMIPSLLSNVVLSYLSSSASNAEEHFRTMKRMILVNFLTTLLPFFIIYFMAEFISSFYGPTFSSMPNVLRILTFTTILEACSSVLKSEFIAQNKAWTIFALRTIRDISLVGIVYYLMTSNNGVNGALLYSWACVGISILFFISLLGGYKVVIKKGKR